jgi:hypothetical protein
MFQLSLEEWNSLRLQIGTSKRGGRRYLPYVFTEQGVDDINEDIRMQLELINETLAELQVKNRTLNKPRNPIRFAAPQYKPQKEE